MKNIPSRQAKRLKDIRDPEGRRIGYVTMDGRASDFSGNYVGNIRDDMRVYSPAGKPLDVVLTDPGVTSGTVILAILLMVAAAVAITILTPPVDCACHRADHSRSHPLPRHDDTPPTLR